VREFLSDYTKAIDVLALVAVIGIAAASFSRTGFVGLLCAAVVIAIWGVVESLVSDSHKVK
jgi:hypothetical protein